MGKDEDSLQYYELSRTLREKVMGKQSIDYTTSLDNIGRLYQKKEKYADAL